MADKPKLVFFHAPHTRATGVRILLEELQAPHERRSFDAQRGALDTAEYLAINPMAKVPCLQYGDAIITEQPAVYTFLADTFRDTQVLSPALDDPDRGPFLRWMSFYGSSFEPALIDRYMKHSPAEPSMSPYGSFDLTVKTLARQLEKGPFFLGARFTALDVLWSSALWWMLSFKMLEDETGVFSKYVAHVNKTHPSFARVGALDEELAAQFKAAADAKEAK